VTPDPKTPLDNQPRLYSFVLNPYPDQRLSSCPFCGKKTGQRKVPLFIHVDPNYPIALNYTCRYCKQCDLLIGHKHELEFLLTQMFSQYNPAVIGNEYLVMGTLDKKVWREGLTRPKPVAEVMSHVCIFKTYYKELRMTQPGWYPAGQEPPVMPPPPSIDWIKPKRQRPIQRRRK
jgi:hypothetical protein